jgi:predicted XRE-type DNA-binding protein
MSTTKAQPNTAKVFQARAQRSGDWWALSVDGHPGIHSQARSLSKAESAVAEAIELALDLDTGSATVVVTPDLPRELLLSVIESRRLTNEATHLQQTAAAISSKVAADLMAAGLTQRDAATAMGISFQRISQLVQRAIEDAPEAKALSESLRVGLESSRGAMDQLSAAAARAVEGPMVELANAAKEASDSAREAIRLALANAGPEKPVAPK